MSLKTHNLIDLPSDTKLKPGQRLIRIKDNIWMPVGVGGTDTPVFTGGDGGSDTSDATASATDIRSGKTAYVSTGKVIGSMPVADTTTDGNTVVISPGYVENETEVVVGTAKESEIITPGTEDVVIPADTYLSGAQTIKGDANLIPQNIKAGVSIFDVVGTFVLGTGLREYYKCANVDTSTKTWSGYGAILNNGVYTFENTLTEGLIYSFVTPTVGAIYSANALAKVSSLYQGIPLDGLVFYAPLKESKATTETGEIIEEYNAEYTVKNGVPCFHSTQNGYLKIRNLEEFRNAYNAGTFSCSFFSMFESGSPRTGFTFIGSNNRSTNPLAAGSTAFSQADRSIWEASEYTNKMIHVVFTSSQYSLKVYVNGEKVGEGHLYTPSIIETNALTIGALPAAWEIDNAPDVEKYIGYMGAVRFYNRSLEENEILALASEYSILSENS